MACNASGDVEAPSCRDGCRVVLSSILLRKRARRHGCARSLSSHKSIAAKRSPKWRGSCGVSGNVCEGREGRIYSPAQTRTRFVLGYSCFLCHSDWAFRFRIIIIIKKKHSRNIYLLCGLICAVQFSCHPGGRDRAVDLPLF